MKVLAFFITVIFLLNYPNFIKSNQLEDYDPDEFDTTGVDVKDLPPPVVIRPKTAKEIEAERLKKVENNKPDQTQNIIKDKTNLNNNEGILNERRRAYQEQLAIEQRLKQNYENLQPNERPLVIQETKAAYDGTFEPSVERMIYNSENKDFNNGKFSQNQYDPLNEQFNQNYDEIGYRKTLEQQNLGGLQDFESHQMGNIQGFDGIGDHSFGNQDLGHNQFRNRRGRDLNSAHRFGGGMEGNSHQNKIPENQNFNQNNRNSFGWLYEMMMCLFLVSFFFNFIFGKSNHKLTQIWFDTTKDFFKKNYKKVGISENKLERNLEKARKREAKMKGLPYEKPKELRNKSEKSSRIYILPLDSNTFKFFAFHKENIKTLVCNFELKRRSDYVSMISGGMMSNELDKFNYQIAIQSEDPIPTVFCLCRNVNFKEFKKTYSDLDFFTKQFEPSFLSSFMGLFAESSEIFIDIFRNKSLLESFKKIERYIELIYYSDQKIVMNEEKAIFFSFEMQFNQSGATEVFNNINNFVHDFVDELCLTEISQKVLKDAENKRELFQQYKLKKSQTEEKNKSNQNIEKKTIETNEEKIRVIKRPIKGLKKKKLPNARIQKEKI